MSYVLRAARPDDLAPIYQMAKSTGGGFLNLPPDRKALAARLERAAEAFGRADDAGADDRFFFVLEETATGRVCGTCQIFTRTGSNAPFYSYRIDRIDRESPELGRSFRLETLTLTTDLDGSSEVGGLYLHPSERSAGVGMLLARARYLFIKLHRARFADRTIAELRGALDQAGGSPFWEGLAGRLFGMSFREADEFNALNGIGVIAGLLPRDPIPLGLLPESALAALGRPHHSGRAAMRMLEQEGFVHESYIDMFDGGPTMTCATDDIATLRDARSEPLAGIGGPGELSIVASGSLGDFRAAFGQVSRSGDGLMLDAASARVIGAKLGDAVTHIAR